MASGAVIARVPEAHRRWILINSVLITAFANIAINVVAALIGARGHHVVWWSSNPFKTSLLYNTLGTLFLLPLLTTLAVTRAVRREVADGVLESIGTPFASRLWTWVCVPTPGRRGLRFAVATFAALAPFDVLAVVLFGRSGVDPFHFVAIQVLYAVLLGAVLTPLIALAAMSDQPAG
ncbi:MAG TPA: hypothetical protein VG650_01405 [Mycobacteriales bacterium]|nr:hypothetical protein [Mycobacteriales bacterium]